MSGTTTEGPSVERPPTALAVPASVRSRSPSPAATFEVPPLTSVYSEAAEALRGRDCDRALALLDPLTKTDRPEAAFARVVQGLYAHACERIRLAQEKLFLGGGRGSVLEDWRLLTLADVAMALDEHAVARAALDKILTRYLTSPLYPRAVEKAVAAAWQAGDAARALELIERAQPPNPGRSGGLPEETLQRLDVQMWEIGTALGDDRIRRRAARRLLILDPEGADELGVDRVFAAEDGSVTWTAVLGRTELVERARALVRADRLEDALGALEAVPPDRRDTEWRLLDASILTRARRGSEALRVLDAVETTDRAEASRLEWERARAARDLASAYRGRVNLPSSERDRWRHASHRHLRRVASLDGDRELSLAAMRRLFFDLADDDRFDDAMEVLHRLRQLDPEDSTGADFLWRRGWEAFEGHNPSTAIGFWSELMSLYPDHRNSRSGRYWTGRAFETLGERDRAREIYREVAAADTADFYRTYALERLAPDARPDPARLRVPGQEPEPWPEDRRLTRARLLTDLGLDDLALAELRDLRQGRCSRAGEEGCAGLDLRAYDVLESEILHRKGELRASIEPIRRAFPSLGGPYQASVPERALRLYYPLAFEDTVRTQADHYGLPIHLLFAMIRQESGFDPGARSHAGARGLLQLMPATGREMARRIGLRYSHGRLTDPAFNLRVGAAYFRQVLSLFDDHLELALAGYNGGPYRIKRLWQRAGQRDEDRFLEGLQLSESRIYVKRILVLSDSYRQLYGPEPLVATTARPEEGLPSAVTAVRASDSRSPSHRAPETRALDNRAPKTLGSRTATRP